MAAGEGSSPGTGHAGPIRTRTTSLLHSVRRKGPSGPSGFFSSGEDNNAFGFTTEFGWYLPIADRAYVEPMVTLAYGRIAGDSYTLKNGVKYEEENMDSLLADIGARAGYKFANNRGSVYAKVRLLPNSRATSKRRRGSTPRSTATRKTWATPTSNSARARASASRKPRRPS